MSGASEKLKKIFNKHYIPLFSNPATHRHRNWSTRKAAHPNTREAVYCMQPNAERNVQTYISDKLNNQSTNAWLSKGGPNPQVKTQQFTYTGSIGITDSLTEE